RGEAQVAPAPFDLSEHVPPAAQTRRHHQHHRCAADENAHRAEQRPYFVSRQGVDRDLPGVAWKQVVELLEHSYSRYNVSRMPRTNIKTGQILLNGFRQFVSTFDKLLVSATPIPAIENVKCSD